MITLVEPWEETATSGKQNLVRILNGKAGHDRRAARGARIEVLVVIHPDSAYRDCPGLIGNLPVWRVHVHGWRLLPRHHATADERVAFRDNLHRKRLGQPAAPVTLSIGPAAPPTL